MRKSNEFFKKIQSYHEDRFSKEIVIPLLIKMGYSSAHFNGGPYEYGKDIIAEKENDFGENEITVIQSKMLKSVSGTQKSQKFGEIVHQLRLCITQEVPSLDKTKKLPSKVIFITPFPINTRLLAEQFDALSINRITILDQSRLYPLLEKYWPSIFDEFEGEIDKVKKIKAREIKNLELHSALHIEKIGSYAEYYSDLRFFVGKTESSNILSSNISLKKTHNGQHSLNEWNSLKNIDGILKKYMGHGLIYGSIPEIECKHEESIKKYESEENKKLIILNDSIIDDINKIKEGIEKTIFRLINDEPQKKSSEQSNYKSNIFSSKINREIKDSLKKILSGLDSEDKIALSIQKTTSLISDFDFPEETKIAVGNDIKNLKDMLSDIHRKHIERKGVIARILPQPKYEADTCEKKWSGC